MTIPAAPTEGGGSKILFVVYDVSGTNTAALLTAAHVRTVNSEKYGDLNAYATTGNMGSVGFTSASTSAQQIHSGSIPTQGVVVWASPANANPVFIGGSSVTNDYGGANSGIPCKPDTGTFVACRDINELYMKGDNGALINIQLSKD